MKKRNCIKSIIMDEEHVIRRAAQSAANKSNEIHVSLKLACGHFDFMPLKNYNDGNYKTATAIKYHLPNA